MQAQIVHKFQLIGQLLGLIKKEEVEEEIEEENVEGKEVKNDENQIEEKIESPAINLPENQLETKNTRSSSFVGQATMNLNRETTKSPFNMRNSPLAANVSSFQKAPTKLTIKPVEEEHELDDVYEDDVYEYPKNSKC